MSLTEEMSYYSVLDCKLCSINNDERTVVSQTTSVVFVNCLTLRQWCSV